MEEQTTTEEQFNAIFSYSLEIIGFFAKGLEMCMDSNAFRQPEQMRLHEIFDVWIKGCDARIAELEKITDDEGAILMGKEETIDRWYQKAKNNHMASEKFLKGLEDLYKKRLDESANADEITMLFENSNYEA